ncbi:Smr/MutS family protein [Ottowia sp.]|uniref:Smr/MutS family protein n=1 Tax=Ottowia sp. TaxID=1898956 RepID=UPI002C6BC568|nr:Smr/MutS family protein [Ottowia sp.]HOB68009.1 Smr/MutS family protein [Ottowia sp.]HPZ55904.1 Smr/MutS family protein [Ottowia sp.]HQD49294.1 Smr/MutS family protein [Ottowia sp.]
MKAKSFQELKAIRQQLAEAEARAAQQAAERAAAEKKARAEHSLFARAVGPAQPLRAHGRVVHAPSPVAPQPLQRQRDEQAVLREAISDQFDATTLLHTDEHLSFRRPGIGADVTAKLRRGHWAVQGQIDLHGLRTDAAREALGAFLRDARRAGLRCVRVVHGKGLGSPGKAPVLKAKVHGWLVQKQEVLAFVQAKPLEGGAGALLVLLAGASARP